MNRILMLSTGGTLASSHSENGLAPGLHGNDILDRISGLTDGFLVEEGGIVHAGQLQYAAGGVECDRPKSL